MATYKVPQDVEAEDKLLGPFTFRQFIYLMVIFGCVLLAIALFQIFPLLATLLDAGAERINHLNYGTKNQGTFA